MAKILRTPPGTPCFCPDTPIPGSPPPNNNTPSSDSLSTPVRRIEHRDSGTVKDFQNLRNFTDAQILNLFTVLNEILKERRIAPTTSDADHRESTVTKRRAVFSPVDLDTSFASTNSLVGALAEEGLTATPKKQKMLKTSHHQERVLIHPTPASAGRGTHAKQKGAQTVDKEVVAKRNKDMDRIDVVQSQNQTRATQGAGPARSEGQTRGAKEVSETGGGRPGVAPARNGNGPVAESGTIPPIVLRDKTKWTALSGELRRKGLSYSKAQNIPDGIRIYPNTEKDFRGVTSFFSMQSVPYHTYQLPSEKLLNVVLRGIPLEIPIEDVQRDLGEMGFSPEDVLRMRRFSDKQPMPLILVKVPKSQKNIYSVKEVVGLQVVVEPLRSRPNIGQCFRCLRFGHAQSRCTAQPRCVRCGDNHPSRECSLPREEPPNCANCGNSHPANYRGCPKFPRIRMVPTRSDGAGVEAPRPPGPPPLLRAGTRSEQDSQNRGQNT